MLRAAETWNNTGDLRMGQGKLQGGCRQWHMVALTMRLEAADAIDDVLWRDSIVIVQGPAVPRPCRQNAGVIRTAHDDGYSRTRARRQQGIQCVLLEQGIAAREQDDVELRMIHGLETDRRLVDAKPKGPDRSACPQLFQRTKAAAVGELAKGRLAPAAMSQAADVVNKENVDAGQSEPLLAGLPRGHHPLEAVIKFGFERQGRAEALTFGSSVKSRIRFQQSAYFAR